MPLFDFSSKEVPISEVRNLNIDAISRWYFQGIPIDGLQRLLFYQPHHIVGYTAGLLGLLALAVRTRPVDAAAFAVSGVCLGLSIAISSFAGLMVTVAAMLYELAGVIRTRDIKRGLIHAIAAAIPLAASVAMVYGLGYVDRSGAVVELVVNRVAVHQFWWVTLLSMGPVIIVTALAIPVLLSERRGLSVLGSLALTSVFFYFFVNVRDHQDVYVGWRVGHFLFMAAAVVVGVLLERLSTSTSAAQPVQWAVVVVALLAGLPTTVIDIYNTQDITNHNQAPGFHWTLMLRPDELQAFDWIAQNTQARCVVPGRSDGARFGDVGVPAGIRGAPHGDWPADLDGAARQVSAGLGSDPQHVRGVAAGGLRARRPRARELCVDRSTGARRASRRRGAVQFNSEPDAIGLQERHHFDLRSALNKIQPQIETRARAASSDPRALAFSAS